MPEDEPPQSSIILYQTEDGRTRIQCRFEDETLWLTQALIAELFQVTVPTVNEHLKGIFAEGGLAPEATIRKFRIVRSEGVREVARELEHYNLPVILAVGCPQATPTPHRGGNAEGRMMNEFCHRPSQDIGNTRPLNRTLCQSHPKATSKPLQSHYKAC
jgi:hypothetical protein